MYGNILMFYEKRNSCKNPNIRLSVAYFGYFLKLSAQSRIICGKFSLLFFVAY